MRFLICEATGLLHVISEAPSSSNSLWSSCLDGKNIDEVPLGLSEMKLLSIF